MTKLPRTCPYCSREFARLDRHLDSRHACGRAAKAARRQASAPNVAAVTSGGPETDEEASRDPPPLPDGLGMAGQRLWRATITAFELDDHEAMILESACRELDVAAHADEAVTQAGAWLRDSGGNVRVHPGLAAARAARLASARLIKTLALPAREG
jgi:hypothetical protein